MTNKKFNYNDIIKKLFFSKKDLINLSKLGHTIGLHSHSHPTLMEKLTYNNKKKNMENVSKY